LRQSRSGADKGFERECFKNKKRERERETTEKEREIFIYI